MRYVHLVRGKSCGSRTATGRLIATEFGSGLALDHARPGGCKVMEAGWPAVVMTRTTGVATVDGWPKGRRQKARSNCAGAGSACQFLPPTGTEAPTVQDVGSSGGDRRLAAHGELDHRKGVRTRFAGGDPGSTRPAFATEGTSDNRCRGRRCPGPGPSAGSTIHMWRRRRDVLLRVRSRQPLGSRCLGRSASR